MSEGKREPIVKNNEVVNERIPLSVLSSFHGIGTPTAEADSETRPREVSPLFSHKAGRF
jgi:hypothetical protein